MPKLEPKAIQKDLENGQVYSMIWFFGPERMKSRELSQRIIHKILGQDTIALEQVDGSESSVADVLEQAQGMGLFGGGKKVIIIRNADALKGQDDFLKAEAKKTTVDEAESVILFFAKSFDGRKKAMKHLAEVAAVVECTAVPEWEREAWIDYLAKRRNLTLTDSERLTLRACDPWSLEIIDQELEKISLVSADGQLRAEVISGVGDFELRDRLLEAVMTRKMNEVLDLSSRIADQPEFTLPFLGLLAWNVRHMNQYFLNRHEKRAPFLTRNLERWSGHWNEKDLSRVQKKLFEIDLSMKSTRLAPLGLWSELAFELEARQ